MIRAANVFEWLDNQLNPILVKELRQAVKNRVVLGILSFFLLFQLLMLVIGITNGTTDQGMWSGGARVFLYQQMILLFTILTALPAYAGTRMLTERTDPGSDLMFLTTLSPSAIIWGKLFGCLTLGLLVFSVCAPFMTLAYLLRGIDLPTIFLILGLDLLMMVLTMQFALFSALLPGGLIIKRLAAGLGFLVLLSFSYLLMGFSAMSIGADITNWLDIIPIVIFIVLIFGYFMVYSIALVSAASANSMFVVRVYITLAVLAIAIMLIAATSGSPRTRWGLSRDEFLPNIFAFCMMPFLCLQILVSVCERDHWGPRITRTIPRFVLFRLAAFLFYSGSAGGVLHAVLMIAMTFGFALYLGYTSTSPVPYDAQNLFPLAVLVLYTYCYCMSGMLLRSVIPRAQLRPENTWILVGILLGVMSAMPNVIAYSIYGDRMNQDLFAWWNLTNPFFYFSNWNFAYGFRGVNDDVLRPFLMLWALVVTFLALPQFYGQLCRFRRTQTETVVYERAQVINVLPD